MSHEDEDAGYAERLIAAEAGGAPTVALEMLAFLGFHHFRVMQLDGEPIIWCSARVAVHDAVAELRRLDREGEDS